MHKITTWVIIISSVSLLYIYRKLKKLKEKEKEGKEEYQTITSLIGSTPLIMLPGLSEATQCTILAKVEFLNIGGSPKDRVALSLIADAEAQHLISPHTGCILFEGTVGSTGISLATIARAKGYSCHIVMPEDVAIEKYELLVLLGATVERVKPCSIVDPNHFVNVARKRAEEMNAHSTLHNLKSRGFFCNQFENLSNFNAHYTTTGPEIYRQTKGLIDALVLGAGTGGTIAGIGRYLKPRMKGMKIILADPEGSGLYNKVKHGVMYSATEAEGSRKRHQIDTVVEGVGLKRLTANFNQIIPLIDDAIRITDSQCIAMSRYVLKTEGLFIGSSSSLNLCAAVQVAKRMKPGSVIVTMLCDHGSRHMTKFWSEEHVGEVEVDGLDFLV